MYLDLSEKDFLEQTHDHVGTAVVGGGGRLQVNTCHCFVMSILAKVKKERVMPTWQVQEHEVRTVKTVWCRDKTREISTPSCGAILV